MISGQARRGRTLVTESPHMQDKPLLFVDIGGVISQWGSHSNARPAGAFHNVDGIIHFPSAEAGIHLLSHAERCDLVRCSGWEKMAEGHLQHALALPAELAFLPFARHPGRRHAHRTLAALEVYAGRRRPLAWADDVARAA